MCQLHSLIHLLVHHSLKGCDKYVLNRNAMILLGPKLVFDLANLPLGCLQVCR